MSRSRAAPAPRLKPRLRRVREPKFFKLSRNTLDQLTWSVRSLQQGLKRCNLDLGTSLLGKHTFLAVRTRRANLQPIRVVPAWVSFGITTYLGLRSSTGRQSSIDIDMIQVIRRDPRSPIVLVSSGFTTDQYVLGAPLGHRRPDFRSYGSACCMCSGMCQLLGRGRGKGNGKLASDQK
ncbi:hypothetical protein E6C27_scaffold30G001240 [Cucumis melo var. makuwa]|uniref:Uncharacterized protein n=1 Tax=Cucumis melo var. makuwa TaxID=1194695 RepID=A0A5A7TUR7_CUCMM|nr:hypothetical protein E6C27_scaffold30G001240 [Cucumis melo var. makuwa]